MTIEVYNYYKQGGFIMAPYTFIGQIGIDATIVLSEIIAEYNFARNKKVSDYLGFILNISRVCKVLNMEKQLLTDQLNYLQELNFIKIFRIMLRDSFYIQVNEDNIIAFKKEQDMRNFNHSWDDGLMESVNPSAEKVKFSESTLRIKYYFDTYAKVPKSIPIIEYIRLENIIKLFEQSCGSIFTYFSEIESFVKKYVSDDNTVIGFDKFYWDLDEIFDKVLKEKFKDEIPPDC